MAKAKPKQKNSRPQKRGRSKFGANALAGIKQGVGAVTRHPFPKPRRRNRQPKITAMQAFDAFMPHHLALPRAIGEYTTVRTTHKFSSAEHMVLGPMQLMDGDRYRWCPYFAVNSAVSRNNPINGTGNAFFRGFSVFNAPNSGYIGCEVTPAAFSFQIINGEAVQTSSGTFAVGRWRTMPNLRNQSISWVDMYNQAITNNAPRVLSAAKLAFRGVQVDLIPFNMSELSDFTELSVAPNSTTTWNLGHADTGAAQAKTAKFAGFAPAYVFNEDSTQLTYIVTCEWRCRFSPGNPAQAGHVHHPVTSDSTWDNMVRTMTSLGHGVRDIAETAAALGTVAAFF